MSRSTDLDRPVARSAGGFTLIEVMVALGVVTLVLLALVPQLIVGIRSTGVSREMTHTKGIAQGQIERMHNLPFHVAREAGQFVDVLDRYYPNASTSPTGLTCTGADGNAVPPPTSATGFVTTTGSRCSYEPAAGSAFYRVVEQRTDPQMGDHTIVVDTQFLSDGTPPAAVTPDAAYNSQTTGKDNPPANQIGVTVRVYSDRFPARDPVTLYTQIVSQPPSEPRLRARSGVRVLEVGSATWDGTSAPAVPLGLSAGVVNIAGSVSTASKITVNRGAVTAAYGMESNDPFGVSAISAAPPSGDTGLRDGPAGSLPEGCALACWGVSQLNSVPIGSDNGLPVVGSASAPVRAEVTGATNQGLSMGNALASADYDPSLNFLGSPVSLVRLDTDATRSPAGFMPCATAGSGHVASAGYVTSTASEVRSCAAAAATVVELFPTTRAPGGVVRLELVAATASCVVQGPSHAPQYAYDYELKVQHWDDVAGEYRYTLTWDDATGQYSDTADRAITPATATDALANLPAAVMQTPVGGGKQLRDYIASWSSVAEDRIKRVASDKIAEVNIPGVITLTSRPTLPDPNPSDTIEPPGVSLTLGALSCYAMDRR